MDIGNPIPPSTQTLTASEAQALADRLYARSTSPLFEGSPEVRRDIWLASKVIRFLLSTVDAALQINVGN
jgi:hypothetical protein